MRRALLAAVIFLLSCLSVQAQAPTRSPAVPAAGPGRIVSIIVGDRGEPLAAAVITVRTVRDSSVVVDQAFTTDNGRFRSKALPLGNYYLRVSRIGFKAFNTPPVQLTAAKPVFNVGTIRLEVNPVELPAVQATAQQSAVVLETDRTVYNTKDMAAAAGTIVDVLRVIPELEVGVNGKVTLRGSQDVVIYLNGRPAPVTGEALASYLQQLPGSMVAKVEVIPNPSARYDPDGMVGIVNIQLKDMVGGNVSANTTSRLSRLVGVRMAHQKAPFSLFGGASINSSRTLADSYDWRQNLLADPVTFVEQRGNVEGDRLLSSVDLTSELNLGGQKTLWAAAYAYWNSSSQSGFARYDILDDVQALRDSYDRDYSNDGAYHTVDVSAGFKGQQLSFELRRTATSQNATHHLSRQFSMWDGAAVAWPDEVAIGDFSTETEAWRAQADYARALTARTRLTFGYLGYNRIERQDNELEVVPGTAAGARAMAMPSTHAAYRYEETVQSLFGMVAQSLGRFSAQLGLRAEVAATEFALPITKETFDRDYNSVYPNVSLSYAFAQTRSLRLAYSRRITRPVPVYMNPSVVQLDPLNRTAGNPNIAAMYSHVFTTDYTWVGERGTFIVSPYYRHTADNWEPIKSVDSLGVSTVSWDNSASLSSYGANVTAALRLSTKVSNTTGVGVNRDVRDADNLTNVYVRAALRWNVNNNLGVQVNPALNLQAFLRYTPGYDLVQGRVAGDLNSVLAVRQQIASRRGLITLQLTDPLDLQRYKFETRDASHVQSGRSNNKPRMVSLALSYNFGRPPDQQSRRSADETASGQVPIIR